MRLQASIYNKTTDDMVKDNPPATIQWLKWVVCHIIAPPCGDNLNSGWRLESLLPVFVAVIVAHDQKKKRHLKCPSQFYSSIEETSSTLNAAEGFAIILHLHLWRHWHLICLPPPKTTNQSNNFWTLQMVCSPLQNNAPVICVGLFGSRCWKATPFSGIEIWKPILLSVVVAALMHSDVSVRLDLLVAIPIRIISSANPSNTQNQCVSNQ